MGQYLLDSFGAYGSSGVIYESSDDLTELDNNSSNDEPTIVRMSMVKRSSCR
jgi:hypothetical protein